MTSQVLKDRTVSVISNVLIMSHQDIRSDKDVALTSTLYFLDSMARA